MNERDFDAMDVEDRIASIETLIEALIRAANKVPNSAFKSGSALTRGGGGSVEKKAIDHIRELADQGPISQMSMEAVVPHIVNLIDYFQFDAVLVQACARAITLACSAAPALQTRRLLLVPWLAVEIATRFPHIPDAAPTLVELISRALSMSTEELLLRDWGKEEAEKHPEEAEGFLAPRFEEHLDKTIIAGDRGHSPTP